MFTLEAHISTNGEYLHSEKLEIDFLSLAGFTSLSLSLSLPSFLFHMWFFLAASEVGVYNSDSSLCDLVGKGKERGGPLTGEPAKGWALSPNVRRKEGPSWLPQGQQMEDGVGSSCGPSIAMSIVINPG